MNSGIYCIINKVNKKFYIGSAKNIKQRWYTHKRDLRNNKHKNKYLQDAWSQYKEESFEFIILEYAEPSSLIECEQKWIDKFDTSKNGYNICPIAGNTTGKLLSDETKDKIRQKAIGRKASDKTREKMSESKSGELNPMYGRNHTAESKKLIAGNRDRSYKGELNPFFGKQHSDEIKKKISEKNKGKRSRSKLTENDILEIRDLAFKGIPHKVIAEKFHMSISGIRKIIRGERGKI